MLVDSEKLGTGGACPKPRRCSASASASASIKGIVTYDWAADGKSILVPLDGELYLAASTAPSAATKGRQGRSTRKVLGNGQLSLLRSRPESVAWASPAAREQALTTHGQAVHWGDAEFIAQEELDRYTGYWWSPKDSASRSSASTRRPVDVLTRAAIGAAGTTIFDQRYPAAGKPNAAVDIVPDDPDGAHR